MTLINVLPTYENEEMLINDQPLVNYDINDISNFSDLNGSEFDLTLSDYDITVEVTNIYKLLTKIHATSQQESNLTNFLLDNFDTNDYSMDTDSWGYLGMIVQNWLSLEYTCYLHDFLVNYGNCLKVISKTNVSDYPNQQELTKRGLIVPENLIETI